MIILQGGPCYIIIVTLVEGGLSVTPSFKLTLPGSSSYLPKKYIGNIILIGILISNLSF